MNRKRSPEIDLRPFGFAEMPAIDVRSIESIDLGAVPGWLSVRVNGEIHVSTYFTNGGTESVASLLECKINDTKEGIDLYIH